jgi:outer membrane protease
MPEGSLMKIQTLQYALIALVFGISSARANDLIARATDGTFWLSGSVGLMSIEAREYVYLGNDKASQLDWDTEWWSIRQLPGLNLREIGTSRGG